MIEFPQILCDNVIIEKIEKHQTKGNQMTKQLTSNDKQNLKKILELNDKSKFRFWYLSKTNRFMNKPSFGDVGNVSMLIDNVYDKRSDRLFDFADKYRNEIKEYLIENNTLWMNENGKSFDFEDD